MSRVMLLVILVATTACGSDDPRKSRAPVQPPAQVETPKQPEETPAQKAAREEAEKVRILEDRARRRREQIDQVRVAFMPEKYPDHMRTTTPSWKAELRGENRPPFATACADYLNWDVLNFASQNVGQQPYTDSDSKPITWEEVGISESQAKSKLRSTGLSAARQFVQILQLPIDVRVLHRKCVTGGEGAGFEFTSTHDLATLTSDILEALEAKPEDLGLTAARWRQIILADYRQRFERLVRTDQESAMLQYAHEAFDNWHFTLEELGLNAEQIQKYRARYAQADR